MSKLTAKRVDELILACMYKDEELSDPTVPPEGAVMVEGITARFGFHPERLNKHKHEIKELLLELPDTFMVSGEGKGWSFLNACMDKHGNHWGEHRNIEALLVLGIAVGVAKFVMPRSFWPMMPGGMPYVQVLDEVEPEVKG